MRERFTIGVVLVACAVAAGCGSDPTAAEASPGDAPGLGGGLAGGSSGSSSSSSACTPAAPLADRDADGWSDAVEAVVGTSPDDAADNPRARGMNVIVAPFEAPPSGGAELVAETSLARADVGILLDTTGSMVGTTTRIQAQLAALFPKLAGAIDDVALGLAGYGDFPVNDGANSDRDVPFYLVHRMMTVRTKAGMDSLVGAAGSRNIADGPGPWFGIMRGGDEPEQGWEALRQAITGAGITYPGPYGGTRAVPPFSPPAAYPKAPVAGEEVGTTGGMGFRANATPILVMVSDTSNHAASTPGTTPPAATRAVALSALAAAHARVVGLMAWKLEGHADLTAIAEETGAKVKPEAWGVPPQRPSNCAPGKCCLVADDAADYQPTVQPDPVGGTCTLVFQSDRYDEQLAVTLAQAIGAVARGVPVDVSARAEDRPGDAVDVVKELVERVEARTDGASRCKGLATFDQDKDGVPDTFRALVPRENACFSLVPKRNTTVPATGVAQRFEARLQLVADGVASLRSVDVTFVVPPAGECAAPASTPPGTGVH